MVPEIDVDIILEAVFETMLQDIDASIMIDDTLVDTDFDELINVNINIDAEEYTGPYTITPNTESQILHTVNKLMTNNVTVKSVPYYETINEIGGTTVYIGKEVI